MTKVDKLYFDEIKKRCGHRNIIKFTKITYKDEYDGLLACPGHVFGKLNGTNFKGGPFYPMGVTVYIAFFKEGDYVSLFFDPFYGGKNAPIKKDWYKAVIKRDGLGFINKRRWKNQKTNKFTSPLIEKIYQTYKAY